MVQNGEVLSHRALIIHVLIDSVQNGCSCVYSCVKSSSYNYLTDSGDVLTRGKQLLSHLKVCFVLLNLLHVLSVACHATLYHLSNHVVLHMFFEQSYAQIFLEVFLCTLC